MLSKDPRFVRAKVGGASLGGRASYWLGSDHLLVVTTAYFTESYRRFYYSEIGALVVRRTNVRAWVLAVSGVFLGLFGLGLLAKVGLALNTRWTEDELAGAGILGVLAGVSLVFFVSELVGGPTCTCRVHTAVQVSELPGVRRWRKAERLLEVLGPRIAAAQGGVRVTGQGVEGSPGTSPQPIAQEGASPQPEDRVNP